jgi:hypothetical protein
VFLNLIIKAINKSFIQKINLFFRVKDYDLFFQVVKNKFKLILFIDFLVHIIVKLNIYTNAQNLKNKEND